MNTPSTDADHIAIIEKYYQSGATVVTDCGESIRYIVKRARQLERELAELRKDAERYRWLRVNGNDSALIYGPPQYPYTDELLQNEELDAAIDAAKDSK